MAEAPLSSVVPTPSKAGGPAQTWEHRELYDRVIKTLFALPWEFESPINITGISVTDLFSFNTALGTAIETSVVQNLNKLRSVWDPDDKYRLYRFVRQGQVFPDVLLASSKPDGTSDVIMGIELKGWFAMAKEGEPSARFTVTPSACAPQDLLVIFPWVLKEVISGSPMLLQPYVEEARYAAEYRNHHWGTERKSKGGAAGVIPATHTGYYPVKSDMFNDKAAADAGGNFGRVSRSGIMNEFIEKLMQETVAGIPLGAWLSFVKIFSEGQTDDTIERKLKFLRKKFPPTDTAPQANVINRILGALEDLSDPEAPAK